MENAYIAKAADLKAVADAIREKGQTSGQLVFPGGFADTIRALRTGAELNFEIVGGTTQPSNPKGNTIWVNTSTTITSWAFSAEAPASPKSGMVWIKVLASSNSQFNAMGDENVWMVYPNSAFQYVSNSWVGKDAQIYQGGAWQKFWDKYYLKGSEQYADITGGWKGVGQAATITDEGIYLYAANAAAWNAYFSTQYEIDLTDVTFLEFDISALNKVGTWVRIGIQSEANVAGDWLTTASPSNTGTYTLYVGDEIERGYIAIQIGNISSIKIASIKRD